MVTVVVVDVTTGTIRFFNEEVTKQEQALETLAVSPAHWLAYVGVGIPHVVVYWLQKAEAGKGLPRKARRQLSALHLSIVVATGATGQEHVLACTVIIGKGSVRVIFEV